MNLLADEGIDKQIVDRLRQDGHSVVYIAEESPGINDEQILTLANQQEAVLLTRDKDFGELVYRLNRITHGVTLVRLDGLHPDTKATLVSTAFISYGNEMIGTFTVISPGNIRIRKQKP
jgi:predicted nuclease of predicted toxin-antitoxin system